MPGWPDGGGCAGTDVLGVLRIHPAGPVQLRVDQAAERGEDEEAGDATHSIVASRPRGPPERPGRASTSRSVTGGSGRRRSSAARRGSRRGRRSPSSTRLTTASAARCGGNCAAVMGRARPPASPGRASASSCSPRSLRQLRGRDVRLPHGAGRAVQELDADQGAVRARNGHMARGLCDGDVRRQATRRAAGTSALTLLHLLFGRLFWWDRPSRSPVASPTPARRSGWRRGRRGRRSPGSARWSRRRADGDLDDLAGLFMRTPDRDGQLDRCRRAAAAR